MTRVLQTNAVTVEGRPRGTYGAFAFAYDQASGKPAFARLRITLETLLAAHRKTPHTHLDLACGTGLALELFERLGYRSVGIDFSMPMLLVAARRAERLVAGDLRAIPLRSTFGAVTLLNDTLTSIRRRSDLVRSFRSIRRCMGPDSLLLFDTTKQRSMSLWTAGETFRLRGRRYDVSIHTSYSRARRTGTMRLEGWARDRGIRYVIDEVHEQRAWSRLEIVDSLRLASLRVVEVIDFRRFPTARTRIPQDEAWLFVVKAIDRKIVAGRGGIRASDRRTGRSPR